MGINPMIHIIQQSCLEKIRPGTREFKPAYERASALCGEEFAYQIVLYSDCESGEAVTVRKENLGRVFLYQVTQTPVSWPHREDDPYPEYLANEPCLLPDALIPLESPCTLTVNRNLTVLWIGVIADFPGDYEVRIHFETGGEELVSSFLLHVLPIQLPKQRFRNCQYIDPCSIAAHYRYPMFCNLHWDHLEKYFSLAAEHGINNIITPIFPVTYNGRLVGSEMVQLVQINEKKGKYTFHYDLLDSWLVLARKNGIESFTFPPIFPSLETLECPKLKVIREQREEDLFEPEEDVFSPKFSTFIRSFIRKLRQHLKELGMEDRVSFQISCAPAVEQEERYARCRAIIRDVITRHRISDVMVGRSFYDLGLASTPIVPLHEMERFLDTDILNREVCLDIDTSKDMVNFLIASPSVRVRAFGLLCRRYDLVGMFHPWFNHYIAPSGDAFDPFWNADGANSRPSGSDFLVYPTQAGPIPSIRLKQLLFAIQDIRVMEALERFIRHERIVSMLKKEFPVTLSRIADAPEKFLALRDRFFERLEQEVKSK